MQSARHEQILAHLAIHRWLTVDDAIRLFEASPATVRRDFTTLAEQGLLERVRGGVRAVANERMTPWAQRLEHASRAKSAIARRAATLVQPHDVVLIDGGTTTALLGDALPEIPLRVVTNSIELAARLNARNLPAIHLYLTGGRLFPGGGILLGPDANASIDQYQADVAFLSVSGITPDGIYNTGDQVAEAQRRMIANATRTIVLADASKFGSKDMRRIATLDQIDLIITDAAADLSSFQLPDDAIVRAAE